MSDFTNEPELIRRAESDVELDVRDDVVDGLASWFEPDVDGFNLRHDLHGHGVAAVANEGVAAVAWRYSASPLESVWGVAARRPISIDGATFVAAGATGERADQQFSRYIDWHGVFTQLGVAAAGRVVLDPLDS
jgi:hypothetical protein